MFFIPYLELKNKKVEKDPTASTTAGFIEDTKDAFIIPMYPTQIKRDSKYGDIGTFTPYSSVPENNWLHGFPHEKA